MHKERPQERTPPRPSIQCYGPSCLSACTSTPDVRGPGPKAPFPKQSHRHQQPMKVHTHKPSTQTSHMHLWLCTPVVHLPEQTMDNKDHFGLPDLELIDFSVQSLDGLCLLLPRLLIPRVMAEVLRKNTEARNADSAKMSGDIFAETFRTKVEPSCTTLELYFMSVDTFNMCSDCVSFSNTTCVTTHQLATNTLYNRFQATQP
jgi:hypothetical protein